MVFLEWNLTLMYLNNMELEIINKLYLELSQIATAETKKELDLKFHAEMLAVALRNCIDILPEAPTWKQILVTVQSEKELPKFIPEKDEEQFIDFISLKGDE